MSFNCENPFCAEELSADHVTLITTAHLRRFCTVECLVESHHHAIDVWTGYTTRGVRGPSTPAELSHTANRKAGPLPSRESSATNIGHNLAAFIVERETAPLVLRELVVQKGGYGKGLHFVSYLQSEQKLEIDKRTWDYGRYPEWWEKIRTLERREWGRFGWEDHTGQHSDSDIVSTNPYRLDLDDAESLRRLAEKYKIEVDITGASPWYPGRTVAIELEPTEATYQILNLTPPSHAAFYQSRDYRIRQKRKELTGHADLIVPCKSHWHHDHVPGSCCPQCGEQCPNGECRGSTASLRR
jgi:hypothetical protein